MMTELKRAGGNELRDFKELSLEELRRGYVIHRDGTYTCIFCGASFETGVIYHSRGRDVTAERAIREHMQEVHSGTFWPMLELDKTLNGLTEVQKTLLSCIYEGKSTDEIGEIMGISTATVRATNSTYRKPKGRPRSCWLCWRFWKARSRLFPARCTERAERSLPG